MFCVHKVYQNSKLCNNIFYTNVCSSNPIPYNKVIFGSIVNDVAEVKHLLHEFIV